MVKVHPANIATDMNLSLNIELGAGHKHICHIGTSKQTRHTMPKSVKNLQFIKISKDHQPIPMLSSLAHFGTVNQNPNHVKVIQAR